MKRIIAIAAFAAAVFAVGAQSYKDGIYFAQEEAFQKSGWKYQAVLEVSGGKIAKATWNGVNNLGLADKNTVAAAGEYGMVKASKLKKEWNEQAATVADYLVKTQDVNFNQYKNAAGNTDAIAGASIHVKEFFDLAKKAIADGPVAKGSYAKDGWYFASAAQFPKDGWKSNVLITVVNGSIVDVIWNALSKDSKKKSKLVESAMGNYGMEKAAKQGPWHVQAERAAAALVKAQNPAAITLKKGGQPDAVTGVSMSVSEFLTLAAEALAAAK